MKEFLIYITFIAVLGFSATAPATQSFDLSVFDKKQVKIEEFTEKMARFYFDGINNLEKPELIEKLDKQCGIHVTDSFINGAGDLGLKFLLGFCSKTNWHFDGTVSYLDTNSPSPKLFSQSYKKDDRQIHFYKNAFKGTYLAALLRIADDLKASSSSIQKASELEHEITIQYSNSLITQLIVAFFDRDKIEFLIKNFFGIELKAAEGQDWYIEQKDFTMRELNSLIKQLLLLGPLINEKNEIKRIVRVPKNTIDLEGAAGIAMCDSEEKTLYIGDAAFNHKDVQAEETFIHELMHCARYNLSDFWSKYVPISWWKSSSGQWKIFPGETSFISTYAMTNPDEDFGEHSTAYVRNPGTLWYASQKKFSYMYSSVFDWTSYRFETHPDLILNMKSTRKKDLEKPNMKGDLNQNFSYNFYQTKPGSLFGNIELNNIYDDLSSILKVTVSFMHSKDPRHIMSFQLENTSTAGKYSWHTNENSNHYYQFANEDKYKGEYCLKSIEVKDGVGKKLLIANGSNDIECFQFDSLRLQPDELQERNFPSPESLTDNASEQLLREYYQTNISFKELKSDSPSEQLFELSLPMQQQEKLQGIDLHFEHPIHKNTLQVSFDLNCDNSCIVYSSEKSSYIGKFVLPNYYEEGFYQLKNIYLNYKPDPKLKDYSSLWFIEENSLGINIDKNLYRKFFPDSHNPSIEIIPIAEKDNWKDLLQSYLTHLKNQDNSEIFNEHIKNTLSMQETIDSIKVMNKESFEEWKKDISEIEDEDLKRESYSFYTLYLDVYKKIASGKELNETDKQEIYNNLFALYLKQLPFIQNSFFDAVLDSLQKSQNLNQAFSAFVGNLRSYKLFNLDIEELLESFKSANKDQKENFLPLIKIKLAIDEMPDPELREYFGGSIDFEDSAGFQNKIFYNQGHIQCKNSLCYLYLIPIEKIDSAISNGGITIKGLNLNVYKAWIDGALPQASGPMETVFLEMGERIITKKLIIKGESSKDQKDSREEIKF